MTTSTFDYLRMSVNEKINYRAETGKTISDIISDNKPEPLKGQWCDIQTAAEGLDLCGQVINKLYKQGRLGERKKQGKKNLYSTNAINKLNSEKTRTFSVKDFEPYLGDYYFNRAGLYRDFGERLYYRFDGVNVFSLKDTADIFRQLRKRKDIAENWKTIEDLWRDLDSVVSLDTFRNVYYQRLRERDYGIIKTSFSTNASGGW